jgi:histone deacetylase 1/2
MHKGFKCLEISSGRVYISRDVVFDETKFPFSKLHSNAGARLRKEISLLPPNLLNISESGQLDAHVTNLPADSNNFGGNYSENRTPDSSNLSTGATGQENTELEVAVVSVGITARSPSVPPRPGAPLTARSPNQPEAATLSSRAAHAREGETTPTALVPDEFRSATSLRTRADPAELPQEDPAPGSFVAIEAIEQQARPRTRLQSGIRKEKVYTDGTIKYDFFTSSDEPRNVEEALNDKNWKEAMDSEYMALMKNKTWHLVPP